MDGFKPHLQRFPLPFFDILNEKCLKRRLRQPMSDRPFSGVGSNPSGAKHFYVKAVFERRITETNIAVLVQWAFLIGYCLQFVCIMLCHRGEAMIQFI